MFPSMIRFSQLHVYGDKGRILRIQEITMSDAMAGRSYQSRVQIFSYRLRLKISQIGKSDLICELLLQLYLFPVKITEPKVQNNQEVTMKQLGKKQEATR